MIPDDDDAPLNWPGADDFEDEGPAPATPALADEAMAAFGGRTKPEGVEPTPQPNGEEPPPVGSMDEFGADPRFADDERIDWGEHGLDDIDSLVHNSPSREYIELEEAKKREYEAEIVAELPPLKTVDPGLFGIEAPPREWLVPGIFPMGVVSGLYGPGGSGKTLLMQQLQTACSIVDGTWLGNDVPCVPTVGIYTEDDQTEMHRRQLSINEALRIDRLPDGMATFIDRDDAVDSILMNFEFRGRAINPTPVLTPFYYQLTAMFREIQPRLIALDNLATMFGGNENDRFQVHAFIRIALANWAREFAATVVLLGHFSKGSTQSGQLWSGSTAWDAAFRNRTAFYRPEEDIEPGDAPDPAWINRREFSIEKSNYGKSGWSTAVEWKDGAYHPVDVSTGMVATIEQNSFNNEIYEEIRKAIATGVTMSLAPRSPNHPARRLREVSEFVRNDRRATAANIREAVEALRREGKLKATTHKGKVREQIVIPEDEPEQEILI